MAAHESAASVTDTIYAISASLPATYDAAGYAATGMVYKVIDRVSQMLPTGSKRPVNKFTPIRGPVEKSKGAPDYGSGDMMMADMPVDEGQIMMKAAEASPNHYSLQVTYPDGEVHYMDVIVSSWQLSGGKEGEFLMRTATVDLCKAPVIVAAA